MKRYVISPADHPNGERSGRSEYGSGDTVVVQNGVFWLSETVAVQGTPARPKGVLNDLDVEVRGEVLGRGTAIDLESTVSEVRGSDILVGQQGYVGGLRHGLLLRGEEDNAIVNHGVIAGTQHAIRAGGDISITNHGAIGTYGDYYIEAPHYHAISITHGVAKITNRGGIYGVDAGLKPELQGAIRVAYAARLELSNEAEAAIVALANGTAVLGGNLGDLVSNSARITGDLDLRGGRDVVTNSGTITGSLFMGAGDDTVRDRGVIEGNVRLGDGDDLFEAYATGPADDASLYGGDGNDTYILPVEELRPVREEADGGTDTIRAFGNIFRAAHVERLVLLGGEDTTAIGDDGDNAVRGNAGANLLRGLAGDDEIIGGGGDDRVRGGEGADRLSGWDGDDQLKGGSGADSLHGGNGADEVLGGLGDDQLSGGIGDDRLKGRDGADRLVGGEGSDLLVGGLGADDLWSGWGDDVLEWRRAEDAGTEPGTRDVVHDLNPERDTLRFTFELAYQAGRFSGERAEVRLVEKGTDTFVRVDADGDGREDMTIVLRGVTGLGEDALAL